MPGEEIVARMGLDNSGYARGLRESGTLADRHMREQEGRWKRHSQALSRAVDVAAKVGSAAMGGLVGVMAAYSRHSEQARRDTERLRESFEKLAAGVGRDIFGGSNFARGLSDAVDWVERQRRSATDAIARMFNPDVDEVNRLLDDQQAFERRRRSDLQTTDLNRSIRAFGAEGSTDRELLRQVEIDRLAAANEQLRQAINNAKDLATNERAVLHERRQAAYETRLASIERRHTDEGMRRNEDILSLQRRRGRIGLQGLEGLDAAEQQAREDAEIARRRARFEVEQTDDPEWKKRRELLRKELEIDVRRDTEIERIRRQREGLQSTSRGIRTGAQIDILRSSGQDEEADALSLGLETQTRIEQIRQLGLGDTEEQSLINLVKSSANAELARISQRSREGVSLGAGFGVLSGQVFAGPTRSERSLESIETIITRIERKMDDVGALT